MKKTITVFKGDGIGPEITDAVIRVLDAAGAQLEYEIFNVGAAEYEAHGEMCIRDRYCGAGCRDFMTPGPTVEQVAEKARCV